MIFNEKTTRKMLLSGEDMTSRTNLGKSVHDSILVVDTGKKNDTGYNELKVFGLNKGNIVAIDGVCDLINWVTPHNINLPKDAFRSRQVKLRITQFWSWEPSVMFKITDMNSTLDIHLIPIEKPLNIHPSGKGFNESMEEAIKPYLKENN